MKFFGSAFLVFIILTIPSNTVAQGIIVDHNSLELFDQIPDQYLQAARNLHVLFMDASVGANTDAALNCFTVSTYGSSRPSCRQDYQFVNGTWSLVLRTDTDLANGLVLPYIRFVPSATRYDRGNWHYYWFFDTWDVMTNLFVDGLHNGAIPAQTNPDRATVTISPMNFDVLSFQFSYLAVTEGSNINDFFTHRPGAYDDVYDLEREVSEHLASANPPRVFVYWTTSLARSIGTEEATTFNEQMRKWCRANNKVLFDFADIESHDMNGNPCYDNRDGVPYTTPSGSGSENYADDGLSIPAICQEKTTEHNQGHLSTAQGIIGVAKGLWITIARIAGWNPGTTAFIEPPMNLRILP